MQQMWCDSWGRNALPGCWLVSGPHLVGSVAETAAERWPATVLRKHDADRPRLCPHGTFRERRQGVRAQHTGKAIATAEFRADDIAVRAKRFAQCGDLNLQIFLGYD